MWILKSNGFYAMNEETGTLLRIDYGRDGIIRVKKNYKTIASFKKFSDAKTFICKTVKKWNGAD